MNVALVLLAVAIGLDLYLVGEHVLGSPAGLYTAGLTENIPPPLQNNPVTPEELPVLMDRFSCRTPSQDGTPTITPGLINVNAAPARVLQLIQNMPAEAVGAIVSAREQLDSAARRSPARR